MRWVLIAALALPAATMPGMAERSDAALVLGTSGASFTVDGQARFLVFISYFDAMDAQDLDADLDYLADRVDGIRVFPNWWNFADTKTCRLRFSSGTLVGVADDGRVIVRPDRLERLKAVLDGARRRGLLVDVSFAAETVRGLSALEAGPGGAVCPPGDFTNTVRWGDYARALGQVASALAGPQFRHVLFDLQNEAGHRLNGATADGLAPVAAAVRAADPDRLLAVSMFAPDPAHQVEMVRRLRLACLDFHDWPRGRGWGARTDDQVRKFRAALERARLTVPVYDSEPDAGSYGRGTAEFDASLAGARQAGAAAWTFHTRAGHDLAHRTLAQALDATARAFLDARRGGRGQWAAALGPRRALGVN